jgi:hypothetical protein
MFNSKNYYTLITLTILSFSSCKKEEKTSATTLSLYDMSKNSTGFVWYKNSTEYLKKSAETGHAQPYLRTRYNEIAAKNLDTNGMIKNNSKFSEGSLIVKELIDSKFAVELYAILYKNSKNVDADAKGWVWGYINQDGTEAFPTSNKGNSCINCHSQSEQIDYMLMNKYFPIQK